MIKQDAHSGSTALDVIRELTPIQLKQEALWWAHTDGNRGTTVTYLGMEHGLCIWEASDGTRMRLKSKPAPLSREENERIEEACRVWLQRSWEEQVSQYREMRGQIA